MYNMVRQTIRKRRCGVKTNDIFGDGGKNDCRIVYEATQHFSKIII